MKINVAELYGDLYTGCKYIRYKGKTYNLNNKDFEKAEIEARNLLKRLYPCDIITIR